MSKDELEAKEKILGATIELMENYGDAARITVRDVAAKAGVGIGLINYHFQTKEKMISQAVQKMISRVIGGFQPLYESLDMKPIDKLRYLLKSTSAFLVSKPGVSRISIVSDLLSGSAIDNSSQTARAYYPVVREVCGDSRSDKEILVLLHILISSIQIAFLRSGTSKETIGFDFSEKQQREAFVDIVIDRLFSEYI